MSSSSTSPDTSTLPAAPPPGAARVPWTAWQAVHLRLHCDRAGPAHQQRRRQRAGDATLPPEADAATSAATVGSTVLGEPLPAVLKAIWKHTARRCGGVEPACYGPADPVPLALTAAAGRTYHLRLLFTEQDPARVLAWQEALQAHLKDPKNNYSIASLDAPQWRTWETLQAEPLEQVDLAAAEVCLDFLTPMSFNLPGTASGLPRHPWLLTETELRRRVAERWFQTCGERPDLSGLPALEVRPWFWEFVRGTHASKSQKGHAQFYAGCAGPLYLRGDWQAWLPWWRWLQEWGLGKETSNGLGAFRLSTQRSHFDRLITDPTRYEVALRHLADDGDGMETDMARLTADATGNARAFAQAIKARTYTPRAAQGFRLPKKGGGHRLITEAAAEDRVIMHATHQLLQEPLDRLLEDACHGYRPGRGVDTACAALSHHLRAGATHVLEADVEAFFDEMDWAVLDQTLHRALPIADERTRHLLRSLAQMPLMVDGRPQPRQKGVLQGAALSPMLANLYLDSFDEALARRGHALVRYGDDLRILGRSEADCRRALADANELLAPLHLRLNPEKTRIQPVDLGLTYLGRSFGTDVEHRLLQRGLLKTPLWVGNDWCFAGLEADSIILKRDNHRVGQYPLLRIKEVVLQGSHAVSTSLLMRCAAQGIPVTLCRASGEHMQTLAPKGDDWLKTAWHHMQRHQALTEEERLEHCRTLVAAKLGNYCGWFRQQRLPPPLDMPHLRQRLIKASSTLEIMGIEGESSRQLFRRVNSQVKEEAFISHARVQRQKPDRWNCLLDAAYMLLFHHLNALVRSAGLNPYLGFLHSPENRFESLVCDLQEPFRHRIDRLVLRWLRLGMIKPDHFDQVQQRWGFTRDGNAALLQAWGTALHSGYSWESGVSLAGWLQRQVLWLENWVIHGGMFQCYAVPGTAKS